MLGVTQHRRTRSIPSLCRARLIRGVKSESISAVDDRTTGIQSQHLHIIIIIITMPPSAASQYITQQQTVLLLLHLHSQRFPIPVYSIPRSLAAAERVLTAVYSFVCLFVSRMTRKFTGGLS